MHITVPKLNKKDPTYNCCYLEEHILGTDPIGEKILLVAVPEESKLELLLYIQWI
jgi:hypothetical protein